MNAYDFYSRQELEVASKLASLACEIKKRREEGFVSMFSSTMPRYFRFFNHGRLLVYFKDRPTFDTKPKNVLLIDEVDRIERESKQTDFSIVLFNGKTLKLRHDDENVVDSWIKSLTQLKEFYKANPYLSEEARRKYKDKIDPHTILNILEELESKIM